MKKTFYYTILMLSIATGTLQAQFVTTGTPTSNAVYTNGSVGIGVTSAPASSIKGYINGMTWISSQDVTGATIPLWIEGNNTGTYGTTTEGRLIRIKNLQSTAFYDLGINQNNGFFISKYMDNHPNSNPSFFISSAGNIGINTTATGERLVVNGNISTTGFIMPTGASFGKVLTSNASGGAFWQTIPGISSQWTTTGNNIYYMGGNIGIGTTTPGERLVVNGNISTTGFIMPTGASFGKVLTSNASGGAFWQTIPGISSQWTTTGNNIYYMAGNIGIGTNTPGERLVVNGNISTTGFIMPTGASYGKVLTSDASGGAFWQTVTGISSQSQWVTSTDTYGDNISYLAQESCTRSYSSYTCNNVGLGFGPGVSPTYRLHLGSGSIKLPYGMYNNDGYLHFGGNVENGEQGMRITSFLDGGGEIRVKCSNYYPEKGLSIIVDTDAGSTERLRIQGDGNIAIGLVETTRATAKLHVVGDAIIDGIIHTKELRACMTPGTVCPPDYVFENDYKLMDLKTLQKFLDKNKHLPDVPSANEMLSNGIGMVEMNMVLLRKVEELTLYVLELKSDLDKVKGKK